MWIKLNDESDKFLRVDKDDFNGKDECKWALNCGVQKLVYSRVVYRVFIVNKASK